MRLAILLGNVIYFLVVPHLPNVLGHDIFRVDGGLFFDLAMCGMVYAAISKVI